ncbi:DUF6802 family protein [Actinophytocola glycyrrhizae]|uniref:DUF6802 family protein n=1 Tax=Actinophytocola glycyrrhizae TaxID=2044873 RepID=A0ABV9S004_9PSEU
MYVDDDTAADTTDTTEDSTGYTEDSADTTGQDDLTVEIDGEEYHAEENVDLDADGQNDTAVVETEDGYLAFADTDGDGTADVAVEYDSEGNPIAGAEYDETTGEWTEEDVENLPTPTGDGADDADGSGTGGTDTTDTDDTTGTSGSGGESITVDMPGEDVDAGPATYDTDGDGTNDTAVVTDADGTTYAFTDTDADGEADQAVIIESDGDVTVAEHTGEDEWTTTEEGRIDSSGEYVPDSGSSSSSASSDAVWADR